MLLRKQLLQNIIKEAVLKGLSLKEMQMLTYGKTDLVFTDYNWNNTADHVKFQGGPDRNIFLRDEGNDVLYIINFICTLMQYDSKIHACRIEIMIHEKLPPEIKSQHSVFTWLQKNYTI